MERGGNELQSGDEANDLDQARLGQDGEGAHQLPAGSLQISEALVHARSTAAALSSFPGSPPTSLADAYLIQEHSIERWGDTVAGWKVGGIPEQLREQLQADWLVGPIFDRSVRNASGIDQIPMPVFNGGFAAIEPELIIQIGDDRAADRLFIGAEIASSPVPAINDHGPTAVVCDFGNNNGLLIGKEIVDWSECIDPCQVSITIDGAIAGSRTLDELSRAPMPALEFYLEHAARQGRTPQSGTYISTGAITGIHEAPVGAEATISFGQWGELNLKLVSARPTSGSAN